jgi:Family of unknown function (DUF6056)
MILKNQHKSLLFFACFVLILILLLCVNTFYWADDYALINDLNKNGVWQNCLNLYLTWDGRLLSLGAIIQGFFLRNLPIELITFLWSLCFLTSGALIFFIINQELQFEIKNKYTTILIVLMLTIVSWLGAYIHFSETIYWGTGGCYSFGLLLGSIWVFWFLKIQEFKINLIQKIVFFVFSIIVGGTTQNLTVALLTLIVVYLIHNYIKKIKSVNSFNFLILISVLLGLSFIMLAPGNAIRMKEAGYATFSNLSFFIVFKHTLFVLVYYFYYSIMAILLSLLVAFGIFNLLNPNIKFRTFPIIKFPKTKENWMQLMFDFKWLWVSLSTILPFILIPNLMARRTVIYFVYFMILFTVTFSIKIFQKSFMISTDVVKPNLFSKGIVSLLIILIGATIFVIYNFQKGFVLKKEITKRENLLKNSKGKTVYLKLIDQNLTSPCYHFTDFFIDKPIEDDFIKTSQEQYFDVKIVIEK